jgi:hypothetical protein
MVVNAEQRRGRCLSCCKRDFDKFGHPRDFDLAQVTDNETLQELQRLPVIWKELVASTAWVTSANATFRALQDRTDLPSRGQERTIPCTIWIRNPLFATEWATTPGQVFFRD